MPRIRIVNGEIVHDDDDGGATWRTHPHRRDMAAAFDRGAIRNYCIRLDVSF